MKWYALAGIACIVAVMALYGIIRRLWVSRQARIAKERADAAMVDELFKATDSVVKEQRERLQTLDNAGLADELNRRRE